MLRKIRTAISIALTFAFLLTAICANASEKISIVCTSFPCYDFARAVADVSADIHLLIKPGMEVHSFEPTPADVLKLAGCDLFVYIGGESDAWAKDILESFGDEAPETLRLFDCIEELETAERDHAHAEEHASEYDEHIWTSPVNAMAMVKTLGDKLTEISPENKTAFAENTLAYTAKIDELHSAFTDIVANAARNEMIFADRFPFIYFAREYELDYHAAFPTCAAESEPSAKTIAALIGKVIEDKIPVIYVLELSNGKTAQTIAGETGAEIRTFHSVQNVSEADFSAGETYVSLMQRNLEALREGLN